MDILNLLGAGVALNSLGGGAIGIVSGLGGRDGGLCASGFERDGVAAIWVEDDAADAARRCDGLEGIEGRGDLDGGSVGGKVDGGAVFVGEVELLDGGGGL